LAIPAVGIIGNTGVGIIDARSIGWVLIGPVVGLFLGIVDNSFLPNSFKIKEPHDPVHLLKEYPPVHVGAAGPKYACEIRSEVSLSSDAFRNSSTVATTRLRRSFFAAFGFLMVEEPKPRPKLPG
jgi:hypothetical protein